MEGQVGTLEDAGMRASSPHTTQSGSARSRMGPTCDCLLSVACSLPGAGAVAGDLWVLLPVAEAVEEAAEDAAVAGQGGAGRGRGRALLGDGLVVVGAGDGVDDLGFGEARRAFDLGHVADEHAVAHDLGLQAGGTVGVPLGFAATGQGHADAELAQAPAQQVSVDAAVAEGVGDPAGPELVHAMTIVIVSEGSLTVG
jgi:hypothetical protein